MAATDDNIGDDLVPLEPADEEHMNMVSAFSDTTGITGGVDGIKVTDKKFTSLAIKLDEKDLDKLIPKRLTRYHYEFVLHGVNKAVANGIRRTAMSEILVSSLIFRYEDFATDNPFALNDMILSRFRLIPIDQTTPPDAVFEINVVNDTPSLMEVRASSIRIVNPGTSKGKYKTLRDLPFNDNFVLFTLEPKRYLRISKITVSRGYGYSFAGHNVAHHGVSIPLDQKPLNLYLPENHPDRGISSSCSNPRVFKVGFDSNGNMPPEDIVIAACDSLIDRMQNVKDLLPSIVTSGDTYMLVINDESDTIGNLIVHTICDLYPKIRFCTYTPDSILRMITIKIRCDEDINSLITSVVKYVIKQITDIKGFFEK